MKGIEKKILKRALARQEDTAPAPAPKHHVTDRLPWRVALRERCAELRAADEKQRAERIAASRHLEPIFTTSDTYVPPAPFTPIVLPHETDVPAEFLADVPPAAAQPVQQLPETPEAPALVADTYEPETYETELFEEPTPVTTVAPTPIMLAGADEPEHFLEDTPLEFEQTPVEATTHKHHLSSLHKDESEVLAALKPVHQRSRTGATVAPKPVLSPTTISVLAQRSRRAATAPVRRQPQRTNYLHPTRTFIGAY